jgi:NCS1 family nucleobase:cation symporter-1
MGSNLPGNALSGGIDLASVFPKYINIRRGAYLMALLSPVVNPWRLVNTATIFLTVLSGYSVFLAPMTGLMVAHYNLVARAKVNVDDLFVGNRDSIYWYTMGINWRAFVAVSSRQVSVFHTRSVADSFVCYSGLLVLHPQCLVSSLPSIRLCTSPMAPSISTS